MHWLNNAMSVCLGLLILGVPAAVLYAASWWHQHPASVGWRNRISEFGVAYSILVLGGMIAFVAGVPHAPSGAEFPYTYRWAPVIAIVSALSLLFALFGTGRVRFAFVVVALGGIAFAVTSLALL